MSDDSKIKEFPDIHSKLGAPTKKSLFERQKAEAEAKRLREEAETAAVYADFVKSFEDNEASLSSASVAGGRGGGRGGFSGGDGGFAGPPKRHFAAPPAGPAGGRGGGLGGFRGSSGPGSLGPPPPSLSRKRGRDGSQQQQHQQQHRDGNQGLFAFENSAAGPPDKVAAFQTSDDEDEKLADDDAAERAAPKPTLHLSSLPPATSPAVVKSLFPSTLTVDAVRMLSPTGQGSTDRRSLSAIVTLAQDTAANDIDSTVNRLQNRYLGWGFYLSLSRHLSSAALGSGAPITALGSHLSSLPFGARPLHTGPSGPLNRAPPPGPHRGGFAPPSSYNPTGPGQYGRGPVIEVPVKPPSDLRQLKLIHKTLEALLTHGPEFEALLMSRVDVQRDEKWAWLWDPRSTGGVWYRWRLWEILTGALQGSEKDRRSRFPEVKHHRLFDGAASWSAPERGLRFEYITHLEEFVSDPEYESSEDEDSGDEGRRRHHHHHGGAPPPDLLGASGDEVDGKPRYLAPLQKSKLTHLLARLPTTTAKLRKGDVARVTAFAIEHAGEGADEVVDLIVSNIEQPFAYRRANPDRRADREKEADEKEKIKDNYYNNSNENNDDEARAAANAAEVTEAQGKGKDKEKAAREKEKVDSSSAKLIALYLISDILSSSSTSGVRHAWRYRQLFETALHDRHIFESLGRLEKDLSWGRLRAEKWRRSVGAVLTLWEGWCVFPQAAQEHFAGMFANPPASASDEAAVAAAAEKEAKASSSLLAGVSGARNKWKSVDVAREVSGSPAAGAVEENGKGKGKPREGDEDVSAVEDVDGEPMLLDDDDYDEDLDGEPMLSSSEEEDDAEAEAGRRGGDPDALKPRVPEDEDSSTSNDESRRSNEQTEAIDGNGNATTTSAPRVPTILETDDGAPRQTRHRPKAEDMFAVDSDEE
ncbi:MAG: hypothetical protein M1819_003948 [Sarea resinae]|nr:MAG: hypothetical protein M1819_003948 [Sarea resinae]